MEPEVTIGKPSIQSITVKNLISFLLALALILLIVTGINFRSLSKQAIESQALAHAELVKSGLTAHMKGGIMEKRNYYLKEIRELHQVNQLHIIRGEQVITQFGMGGELEKVADADAKRALISGHPVFVLNEFTAHPSIRAIIPYTASTQGELNCLSCHDVKEGSVLGAVDIELDVTEYRNQSLLVISGLTGISLVFLLLILINTSRTIQRHVKDPLESLIEKARKAYQSQHPVSPETFATREFTHVADEINLFNNEIIAHQDVLRQKNQQLQLLNEEIENTVRETVYTMGVIEEQRSQETNNHTKRVSLYCQIMARSLGLPDDEIDLVTTAAPLHDIGKLGIPDDILLKPYRLTSEERKIMENHPRIGHSMLMHSSRDILKAAALIALQHHEKWDGSGYPNGLAGEQIHIFGRIVALADVFDALISERIYKQPWNIGDIVEWITAQSGKHFDPALVSIFLDNIEAFVSVFHHHPTNSKEDIRQKIFGSD